jgi:glyoxylate reductase
VLQHAEEVSALALEILGQLPGLYVPEGNDPMSREELLERASTMEGLLVDAIDPVDREVIEAAPQLRVISSMGAGYDNVDMHAANERGILVCNAPGFSTDNVADHTFGLMIAIARRMIEHNRLLRAGRYHDVHSQVIFGHRVSGATLGIVGLGTIGAAVARRARAFDMPVLYASRSPKPDLEAELELERVDLDDLLRRSDFVSLHTELNAETAGMIGERELSLMKSTAVLVNTSRGSVVDTDALTAALREGRILGAGLDVTDPNHFRSITRC